MDKESLAAQIGLNDKDEKTLEEARRLIDTGLKALVRLEELGLRVCEEREECTNYLAAIDELKAKFFTAEANTNQGELSNG